MEAAGINCRNVQTDAKPQKHDKQKIIDTLRQRHNVGLTIKWTEVCLENRTFALAAKHTFGSWGKALVAAGIHANKSDLCKANKWDAQKVIAAIQERHRQSKSLKRKDVLREDPSFVKAVRKYFRLWRTALEAAGVVSKGRQTKENATVDCNSQFDTSHDASIRTCSLSSRRKRP